MFSSTVPAYDGGRNNNVQVVDAIHVKSGGGGFYQQNPAITYSSEAMIADISDISIRNGFIRKVYTILSIQLLVTFGFVAVFTFSDAAINYIQENPGFYYAALILSFVFILILACCTDTARKYPWGLIFLGLFTLCESLLIGVVASNFAVIDVVIAVGATMGIFLGLTIFACQTKYDFTGAGPYLLAALLGLLIFGFVLIFVNESRTVRIIYAAIGTILFSFFIIYDTQLIIGGDHKKYQFEIDDYVFAALNLYLDIINLLLFLLILLGGGDS